jgi:hypothetical protein
MKKYIFYIRFDKPLTHKYTHVLGEIRLFFIFNCFHPKNLLKLQY